MATDHIYARAVAFLASGDPRHHLGLTAAERLTFRFHVNTMRNARKGHDRARLRRLFWRDQRGDDGVTA